MLVQSVLGDAGVPLLPGLARPIGPGFSVFELKAYLQSHKPKRMRHGEL